MDDYIEVRAKTVDDAITEALLKLETTSDKIEYEVIDKGSSGFLGLLGAKPAVIRVRKKFNLVDNVERFLKDPVRATNMEEIPRSITTKATVP